jgi:hypothetical protein
MMHIRRVLAPAVILLFLLSLFGCSKSNSKTPQAASPAAANVNAMQPAGRNAAASAAGNTAAQYAPGGGVAPTLANSSANPSSAPPSAAAAPAPAPEPIVIPAGTPITVRLQQSLSSASASPGERFEAVLDQPIAVGDRIVLPVGTPVSGHVTIARRSGRLRHPGELGLALDSVTVGQQQIPLATASVVARGRSHKRRNLAWIGGAGGGGALIGALAAGGKGALIGAPIGLAAGTTTAYITGKKDVGFGVERRLTFRLRSDVALTS